MGLFGSKFELTGQQTKKLNSLLPETLKKEDFTKKDFESLAGKMQTRIYDLENLINHAEKNLKRIKEEGSVKRKSLNRMFFIA